MRRISDLKNKDWMMIISHYVLYTTNSNSVRELIEKPIKMAVAFMLITDWILLRADLSIDRIVVLIGGAILLPAYLLFQYKLGENDTVLKFKNKMAQLSRSVNDKKWERAFKQIDEIHKETIK